MAVPKGPPPTLGEADFPPLKKAAIAAEPVIVKGGGRFNKGGKKEAGEGSGVLAEELSTDVAMKQDGGASEVAPIAPPPLPKAPSKERRKERF